MEAMANTIVLGALQTYSFGMGKRTLKDRAPRPSVVYMATNIKTGERYIGFTSQPFKRRKAAHMKGAINGWSPGRFAEAICEHGPDAFEWRIVSEFANPNDALNEDQRLIKETRPEYNRTSGGGAYKPLVHSDSAVERLRELATENIDNWKSKYAHLGPQAAAKKVVCLDDGEVYPSAAAAGRAYGVSKTMITEICNRNGRRRSAAGKVFRFFGEHLGGQDEAIAIHASPYRLGKNPYPGVYAHISDGKSTGRWRSRLSTGGRSSPKNYCLGLFDTVEQAIAARLIAKRNLALGILPKKGGAQ